MKQTVIGLAGHIDHGKTALVQALTGINTDQLTEEQIRGMTIDLGFAFLDETITMIDVPGHEKFVKNMMSGVSGVDVALLVVASDDGVMPQTREHFEILKLLEIPVGVIAINKIDISEEEWLDLVELDITEMIKGSFMENAPIIRVSAKVGNGIEKLRQGLLNMCKTVPVKKDRGIFRLHVDRVFIKKGYGTVVTGTVNSGSISTGDKVSVLPASFNARIRGLQSHGHDVKDVHIGDRAAINLQSIEKNQIERGSQIVEPGYLQSMNQAGVVIQLLNSAEKPILQNQRIRIHLGTQEVMARIALIEQKSLQPGTRCPALLRFEKSLVAAKGDKFIIRSFSPIITIGGGEIIEVLIRGKWKNVKQKLYNLFNSPITQQFIQMVEQEGTQPLTPSQLQYRLGIAENQIHQLVNETNELFWLTHNKGKWLLTHNQWNRLINSVQVYLKEFHKTNPIQPGAQREKIRQHLNCEESILDALFQSMLKDKIILQKGQFWLDPEFSVTLSNEDTNIQLTLLDLLNEEGFASSNLSQLASKTGYPKDQLMRLLKVAEDEGKLLRIDGNLMFTYTNFEMLQVKVKKHFNNNNSLSISDFKDLAQTSRKYAVPLLEYFDKQKITYREGNERKLIK